MTEIRARVDAIVEDPATAEALKPWYRQLCKRPCFHDEYLQAYNEPGCHLVDTDGKGVERIDATGVWVGGVHYDARLPDLRLRLRGRHRLRPALRLRDGRTRRASRSRTHWADGMQSLHGIHVHGFPNLFVIGLNQGANLISNITYNLVEAGTTIAAVVSHALAVGADQVEVTEEAEQAWVALLDGNSQSFLGNPDCTPGYYNNEGRPVGRRERLNASGDPAGPVAYFEFIDRWRSSGAFEGLEFRSGSPAPG